MSLNWSQKDMTVSWPMWLNSFGARAEAFATSFLQIPKAWSISAFPSVETTLTPEVIYVSTDDLNSLAN
jgi:hypothetical protein